MVPPKESSPDSNWVPSPPHLNKFIWRHRNTQRWLHQCSCRALKTHGITVVATWHYQEWVSFVRCKWTQRLVNIPPAPTSQSSCAAKQCDVQIMFVFRSISTRDWEGTINSGSPIWHIRLLDSNYKRCAFRTTHRSISLTICCMSFGPWNTTLTNDTNDNIKLVKVLKKKNNPQRCYFSRVLLHCTWLINTQKKSGLTKNKKMCAIFPRCPVNDGLASNPALGAQLNTTFD